jgi:hypothetical protein
VGFALLVFQVEGWCFLPWLDERHLLASLRFVTKVLRMDRDNYDPQKRLAILRALVLQ